MNKSRFRVKPFGSSVAKELFLDTDGMMILRENSMKNPLNRQMCIEHLDVIARVLDGSLTALELYEDDVLIVRREFHPLT